MELDGTMITSKRTMNVLGITFGSALKWKDHVEKAIKESNSSLYAIKMIRKYFSTEEIRNLLTALYYSKILLYEKREEVHVVLAIICLRFSWIGLEL